MPPELQALLAEAFRLLARGVADRRSAFHTPTLATVGLDGRPRQRTVVMRSVDPALRQVRFHTDIRSAKTAELRAEPRMSLHAYDPGARIQIRLDAIASIHSDNSVAEGAWLTSQPMSRLCYGTQPGPGSIIEAADAFTLPATAGEAEIGRENFLAVVATVTDLEWLHLAHAGHRRAVFSFGEGESTGRWLAP